MSLDKISADLSMMFRGKSKRVKWFSLSIRIILILGGTLLAAIFGLFADQGLDVAFNPKLWTEAQLIAVIGLVLVFAGSVFGVLSDGDSIDELYKAQEALNLAKDQRVEILEIYDELLARETGIVRLQSLYGVFFAARGAYERALNGQMSDKVKEEEDFIEFILEEQIARRLSIAAGFELKDLWTICVYKASWNPKLRSHELRLIAHHRSVNCNKADARVWREGVGVGGVALAKRNEVVVPDLDDPAAGSAVRLEEDAMKPEDRERYKSMFAVPIFVGEQDVPWGVAMATSSVSGHFGTEDISGVQPEEAVRTLAGVAALAVTIVHDRLVMDSEAKQAPIADGGQGYEGSRA